jgi:glycosyltransferase involved in cell wall biosynthesis
VRLLRRPHEGLGATRNAGVAAATGSLIGFCDADDWWKPRKASVQVAYLEEHPEIDVALCRQDTHFEPGVEPPEWLVPDQRFGDLDGVSPTSALFRRTVFERLRYRTDMSTGSDFNLLVQARAAGFGIAVIDEALRVRRIHGANMTDREGPAFDAMFATVRQHLRQRR